MNINYKSIKSFEDACKAEGLDAKALTEKWEQNGDTKDEIAYKMLKIFLKAINGDWKPNMGDGKIKYFAWFWVNAAGSGFSNSYCDISTTHAHVGSRLCCETRVQIEHAMEYGEQMYKDFLL